MLCTISCNGNFVTKALKMSLIWILCLIVIVSNGSATLLIETVH